MHPSSNRLDRTKITMPESRKKDNSKTRFYVSPTARLDLISALTKAIAQEQTKGRKHKNKLFEQVDLFVMVALIGHRNNQDGHCTPSHATIAESIGVSVSTVQRSYERLEAAGFTTVIARFSGKEKLTSQVDINFDRGVPWISKTTVDQSPVTDPPVTDDRTSGPGCYNPPVTSDRALQSPVTDKHGELKHSEENPEKKHSESTPCGAPLDGLTGLISGTQVAGRELQGSNDNNRTAKQEDDRSGTRKAEQWPADYLEQFWSECPVKVGQVATFTELTQLEQAGTIEFKHVIDGMRQFARTSEVQRKLRDPEARRFIVHPANWLKQRRWTDDYSMPAEAREERHRRILSRRTVAI
jgi:hypothetical protein